MTDRIDRSAHRRLSVLYYCGDRGLDLTKGEGYRIHVLKILEGLRKQGHSTFLLTINDNPVLNGFEEYACVPHRYMRGAHHLFPYTGTIDSLALFRAAARLHRTRGFDVIHERFGLYSYGGVLASKLLGIPLVLEVNGPGIEEKGLFTTPITGAQLVAARTIRSFCARSAHRIVVVSNMLKRFVIQHWGGGLDDHKIVVIPNAADTDKLRAPGDPARIRQALGLQEAFIVGFLGTFQAWYGIEHLIEAFPAVLRRVPHARLLLVGDGHIRGQLERQVSDTGLDQAVRFTGYIPHDEVPDYLAAFDVGMAAFRDIGIEFCGSPIKLFEYMAAGKAIVASRIGQIPEIVEDGRTALLIEPGDIGQLTDAIVRLAEDPALRQRLGGAAQVEGQKYSWDAYAQRLEAIYRDAIAACSR